MKSTWKLQDAKSQFSKVVEDALNEGPQYVTRRGEEAVVIISTQRYKNLTSKTNFKDFLLSCPKIKDLELERQKDLPRNMEL